MSKPNPVAEVQASGTLQLAQAIGDFEALRARDRRVLRVNLGKDVGERVARGLHKTHTASA